jgi:hypothetical protein
VKVLFVSALKDNWHFLKMKKELKEIITVNQSKEDENPLAIITGTHIQNIAIRFVVNEGFGC